MKLISQLNVFFKGDMFKSIKLISLKSYVLVGETKFSTNNILLLIFHKKYKSFKWKERFGLAGKECTLSLIVKLLIVS